MNLAGIKSDVSLASDVHNNESVARPAVSAKDSNAFSQQVQQPWRLPDALEDSGSRLLVSPVSGVVPKGTVEDPVAPSQKTEIVSAIGQLDVGSRLRANAAAAIPVRADAAANNEQLDPNFKKQKDIAVASRPGSLLKFAARAAMGEGSTESVVSDAANAIAQGGALLSSVLDQPNGKNIPASNIAEPHSLHTAVSDAGVQTRPVDIADVAGGGADTITRRIGLPQFTKPAVASQHPPIINVAEAPTSSILPNKIEDLPPHLVGSNRNEPNTASRGARVVNAQKGTPADTSGVAASDVGMQNRPADNADVAASGTNTKTKRIGLPRFTKPEVASQHPPIINVAEAPTSSILPNKIEDLPPHLVGSNRNEPNTASRGARVVNAQKGIPAATAANMPPAASDVASPAKPIGQQQLGSADPSGPVSDSGSRVVSSVLDSSEAKPKITLPGDAGSKFNIANGFGLVGDIASGVGGIAGAANQFQQGNIVPALVELGFAAEGTLSAAKNVVASLSPNSAAAGAASTVANGATTKLLPAVSLASGIYGMVKDSQALASGDTNIDKVDKGFSLAGNAASTLSGLAGIGAVATGSGALAAASTGVGLVVAGAIGLGQVMYNYVKNDPDKNKDGIADPIINLSGFNSHNDAQMNEIQRLMPGMALLGEFKKDFPDLFNQLKDDKKVMELFISNTSIMRRFIHSNHDALKAENNALVNKLQS